MSELSSHSPASPRSTGLWQALRSVTSAFLRHDDMSLAAAVAFYTAFSFAPLVVLLLHLGGFMSEAAQQGLLHAFEQQLGPRAGEVTEAVVEGAQAESAPAAWWRSGISVVLLLISASAVFGQLQTSLNIIWEVELAKTPFTIWAWIRKRLLSLGMVVASLFILLVSLVLSSIAERVMPAGEGGMGQLATFVTSFVVSSLLFAAIFRLLPDRWIAWRQVWTGAILTGGLFSVGKLLLALYLERSGVADSYGKAAGAVVVLLVWVYYSCIILFIGAEVTRQRTLQAPARTTHEKERTAELTSA